jgi:inosine/xanthosine triphosphatase
VIVRVGSTKPAKVEGTREALREIARLDARFADAVVQPHDCTDIAPRQPMSIEAILAGAVARATALSQPSAFAVGVEGGLHEVASGLWTLQSWAAVTDGVTWGYGAAPALQLPDEVVRRVRAGDELGDVIDELVGHGVRGTRGAWGVLTLDLISRRDAFRLAVTAAFAPFYNARAWRG